jgi:hypothetical protein
LPPTRALEQLADRPVASGALKAEDVGLKARKPIAPASFARVSFRLRRAFFFRGFG